MLQGLWKAVLEGVDWLLPPACQLCGTTLAGTEAGELCRDCRGRIPSIPTPRCPSCLLPHAATSGVDYPCEACLRDPLPVASVTALGLYDAGLREAIHRFKFRNAIGLQRPLGAMLAMSLGDTVDAEGARPKIVPVPLHPRRLRERTYNQSRLLAVNMARHLQCDLECQLLVRKVPTLPQQELALDARRRNVRGAFEVTRRLSGEHLLLVDDVMTSGATLRSCATALLKAGAGRVDAAVLARAPRLSGRTLSGHADRG